MVVSVLQLSGSSGLHAGNFPKKMVMRKKRLNNVEFPIISDFVKHDNRNKAQAPYK